MKGLFGRKRSSKKEDRVPVALESEPPPVTTLGATAQPSFDKPELQTFPVVVSFDFGTTFSGYAFSLRDDPMKVFTNETWTTGRDQLLSLKTSTCLLLTPQKKFAAFGFEAENKYMDLVENEKHHDWFLFRRFKMLLHNNQGLTRESTVTDISGKTMPALTVFAMSIGYLRNHFLGCVTKQTIGIMETDIKYVLTVPAIWSDNAKQFMREAGIKAGIDGDRLSLALEPEAASMWCQTVSIETSRNLEHSLTAPGSSYMVADLGGGTADISVHERMTDGSLKQLHRASGGPWGGNSVNENYVKWCTDIFGEETMKRFKDEHIEDYMDLERDIEIKKRSIKSDSQSIRLRLSTSLRNTFKTVESISIDEKLASIAANGQVKILSDKLIVDILVGKGWFEDPVNSIVSHIQEILADPKMLKVNVILLVGGFSECLLVQVAIKSQIQDKQIIIPNEAGLAVLKGAVRIGHSPGIVSTRIASLTYGMNTVLPFDPEKHPSSKLLQIAGNCFVKKVFGIFVRCGEEISTGHEEKRIITPTTKNETVVRIYTSERPHPYYTDEPDCRQVGVLKVQHPGDEPLDEKEFEVTFFFGETELHVSAKSLKNNKECKTVIDYL